MSPSPPWWSPTQLHRAPAQGSLGMVAALLLPPCLGLGWTWVGLSRAMVTPGPAKRNTVTVGWTPTKHLAEDMGMPHETLKMPEAKKTKSEGILTCLVLSLCKDGGVTWAGSTKKGRFVLNNVNSYSQISLSVSGILPLATAEGGRDVLLCHGDRVALWRSPVTVVKVTQSCFE